MLPLVREVVAPSWRTYGEIAHAHVLRNPDLQEPWRAQGGLEYESKSILGSLRVSPYAAMDVSVYEEDDWHESLTIQLGVVRRDLPSGQVWHLGVEYYNGRSVFGEFFQEQEEHLAWGFWLDL